MKKSAFKNTDMNKIPIGPKIGTVLVKKSVLNNRQVSKENKHDENDNRGKNKIGNNFKTEVAKIGNENVKLEENKNNNTNKTEDLTSKKPIKLKTQASKFQIASKSGRIIRNNQEDADKNTLDKPKPMTFINTLKKIEQLKNEEPNLNEMLANKILSPNTAKYLIKKKAGKVTLPDSKKVFNQIVSLDVSGNDLIKNVEHDMNKRAQNLRAHPLPRDPEPTLSDYENLYNEAEFVSSRYVGPSNLFEQLIKDDSDIDVRPKNSKEELCRYFDIILNK